MSKTYHVTKDGISLEKATFVRDYSIQFVAAWTAKNYEDYCARSIHDQLGRPPWEDAFVCAKEAWDHLCKTV